MAEEILGLDRFRKGRPEDALNSPKLDLEKSVPELAGFSYAEVESAMSEIITQLKYREALYNARETYKKLVIAHGFTNPNTLVALRVIAKITWKQERYDESLNIYQEVYHNQVKYSGPRHDETLTTLKNMACLCLIQNFENRDEGGLPLRKKIYNVLKDDVPNEPFTLQVGFDFAEKLSNCGQLEEALKILKEVNTVYNKIGIRDLRSLKCLDLTAKVLAKTGKHTDALEIWEILKTEVESFGSYQPNTYKTFLLNIRHGIAFSYAFQGKFTESLNAYEELYATELQNNGEYHPAVLSVQNNIATIFAHQGKYAQSLEMFRDVYRKRVLVLGAAHPGTISCERNVYALLRLMYKKIRSV